MKNLLALICLLAFEGLIPAQESTENKKRTTAVSIEKDMFYINDAPTFQQLNWEEYAIEGLLPNIRVVQGIFDDLNPATRDLWAYPDTKQWDPERNTSEFVAAMPDWRRKGLLAIDLNLQGGNPRSYADKQPWINSAIDPDGNLRPAYMSRLEKIIDKADELGMVVILGIYYGGQDQQLKDEASVKKGISNTIQWLFDKKYTNVMIEIANETDDSKYDHEILKPARIAELITFAKSINRNGNRFLVSTSYSSGNIPSAEVAAVSDFILLHGDGLKNPDKLIDMVIDTRRLAGYTLKPIVFNEDNNTKFDLPWNDFIAATSVNVSWGFFDFRLSEEGFDDGFQSIPVNWKISSERKKGFFNLLREMTHRAR